MKVINTVSWAGEAFSHLPGEVVDLDEATARERIAAGLAMPVAAAESAAVETDAAPVAAARKKAAK